MSIEADAARRYAVYYLPPPGPLAEFGARWLGWDAEAGHEVAHPAIGGLPAAVTELTATPRKYGFHGTLKPPFRLVPGRSRAELERAIGHLAEGLAFGQAERLELAALGGFLALVPRGARSGIDEIAAACVQGLDTFRAAPGADELARRRAMGLSDAEEANLRQWGYPFVLDSFRFHMTLTGRLAPQALTACQSALTPVLTPLLPQPFRLDALALLQSDDCGRFHLLRRFPLSGQAHGAP